jgi:hypothetical protein
MIIGISGKIGSGKDTLAGLIIKNAPHRHFKIAKFADKLKQICSILSGLPIGDMYSEEGKQKFLTQFNLTVGELQQKIGTEVMRDSFDTNVWVKALFGSYDPDRDNWIITDVRFPNEADACVQHEAFMFRIEGDPAGVRENSTRNMNHPSETSLDNYDWIITMASTM